MKNSCPLSFPSTPSSLGAVIFNERGQALIVGMTLIGVIGKIIGWRQKTRIWQKLMKAFCEHQLAMYGIYNKEYYYFKNDIYIFNET